MTTRIETIDTTWLKRLFGKNVTFDELMSKHTSLKVGGPADVFVEPESQDQLIELIGWLGDKHLPYLVVGEGTNLLVKDQGIQAVVISLLKYFNTIEHMNENKDIYRVNATAGVPLKHLCKYSLNHSLSGMNFALGIPGTIGGGIKMNAGTTYGEMKDVIESIQVLLPDGSTQILGKDRLKFTYRNLSLGNNSNDNAGNRPVILNGSFILNPGNTSELKDEAVSIMKKRKKNQPLGWASAGSFFKNPSRKQPAGWLIDQAGLKGKTKGNAQISTRHANFIVNTGNASAADILWLMEYAQEKVFHMFNIQLEPEVNIVGT